MPTGRRGAARREGQGGGGGGAAAGEEAGDSGARASGLGQTAERWSRAGLRRASPEPAPPQTEPPETPSKTPPKGRELPGREAGASSEKASGTSGTPPPAAAKAYGAAPSPAPEPGETAEQRGAAEANPILRQVVSAFSPVRSPAKAPDSGGPTTPRTENYHSRWGTIHSVIGSDFRPPGRNQHVGTLWRQHLG